MKKAIILASATVAACLASAPAFAESLTVQGVVATHGNVALTQQPGRAQAAMSAAKTYVLTVREREVLEQMIAGETSKEIARILRISPRTVQVHRSRVLSKLSARNATEAVRIALTSGGNL